MRAWWLVVMSILTGCNCHPDPTPDGGPTETPPALAWPAGARLTITDTTENSASLRWPQATGPVASYRLTANGESRDLTTTDTVLSPMRPGAHVAVSVVAVDAAGNVTPPLHAEAAAAEKLVAPDGDVSTDFCGANAFLIRGVSIPCESLAVVTGHVRTRDAGADAVVDECVDVRHGDGPAEVTHAWNAVAGVDLRWLPAA